MSSFTCGEFLRFLVSDDGARGFLMRCVATLIISPLQSSTFGDPVQLSSCELLLHVIVPWLLRMCTRSHSEVDIPVAVAQEPQDHGGLDLGLQPRLKKSDILHDAAISGSIPDSGKKVALEKLEIEMRKWRRSLSMQVTTRSSALLDD